MANDRATTVAGIIGAAVLAAGLLLPAMRVGVDRPWLAAAMMIVPVAALLTATGYRHYGLGRAFTVALVVTVVAGGVSWLVAIFTLVKALSGAGVGLAWAILLFATPVFSVVALGVLALRVLASRPTP
ncbi:MULTISPECIES: hypothetical protein [Mycolicibacterium]|jgi:hypothetical protein|uniref:Uncharacterized protein n=2 Tax=Mycolicibacterium TaxID=1866885 RepID=A1T5H5_MYCVP|nr:MULTISPECIES: hypothetical protein [Mycolicibacterium]ABM12425.1 hypothetical protein Mvan_1596 [Mycolicibacterium vanbaalenii PYR-1]MCV7129578.1 hypothetical protein [Mycolicibacterium vanbaalenii PYR-1]MDN4521186.1 hypothetical protein [Mycolicibacterium austroafricanum]MDW5611005.1 hypothetical protein [Mycolicibacterium sp. D5.8-2]QZT58342.1 hypothetical protein JN084_07010 [Mycolicibacterium austroafricanum]